MGPLLIDLIGEKKLGESLPIGTNSITTCGHESQLISSFREEQNILKLDPRDGESLQLYPLYINDKEGGAGWNCYRVNVRNACVSKVEPRNGGYRVHLAAHQDSEANNYDDAADVVDVTADGKIDYSSSRTSKFYLLKRAQKIVDALDDEFSKFRCRDGDQPKKCYTEAHFSAQWKVLREFRSHIRAQNAVPQAIRKSDPADTDAYLEQTGFTRDSWMWRYHEKLRENESSDVSPFEVSDALDRDSGLTFGIHQIDIGTNEEEDRKFFRGLMRSAGVPARDAVLGQYLEQKCFEKPLRWIRVRDWGVLKSRMPTINEALRINSVKKAIVADYAKYLSGVDADVKKLPVTLRSEYPTIVMLIFDVKNQYPPKVAEKVRTMVLNGHAEGATAKQTGCSVLTYLLGTSYGETHPKAVRTRFENTTDLECS